MLIWVVANCLLTAGSAGVIANTMVLPLPLGSTANALPAALACRSVLSWEVS